jgi:group I intron endonuclease
MTSVIYRIRNLINGHCYIGSSVNIERRWKGHIKSLQLGRHSNRHLQSAFDKHGESAFVFEVLEITDDCIPREQFYLDTLHPEYNLSPTARSNAGCIYSAEARARMSAAQEREPPSEAQLRGYEAKKGKPRSPEARARMSAAKMGKPMSAEARQKMSIASKGKPKSAEHRANIGAANKGKPSPLKGKPHTSEAQLRGDAAKTGKTRSPEAVAATSAANKGKHRNPAQRSNISAAKN